jgi:heterodisulfide reductase subunit B
MVNLKYAFFSGCVTPQKENSYELSIRKVCQKLSIGLVDLEETNCCGFFVEPVDYEASVIFAARNLALMDETGLDAVTPCSACFGHLTRVRALLLENEGLRSTVNQALKEINRKFTGCAKIEHIVGMLLKDVGIEKIKDSISRPLGKLRIAPHYGCHILKPSEELHLDNPEDPKLLDSLIEVTGAKCVDYSEKKLCCGSSAMNVDQTLATKIIEAKLDSIKDSGADAIVTICPACHVQFDLTAFGLLRGKSNLPILHYTQLLGLAQGWGPQELGLYENRVSVDRLLEILQI